MKTTREMSKVLFGGGVVFLLILTLASHAVAQTCLPPPAGMVSWWPGDGQANDIQDGNHGTLQGGAGFAPGMVGQAFSFDGSDDFVRVPNSPGLNPSGSFSIDAWIFPTQDEEGGIVVKWGDTGVWANERAYTFHTLPGLALRFAISNDAHQGDHPFHVFNTPANVIALNTWNHVTAVYDQPSGTRRIYVNGALVAQRTDPPITVTDSIADLSIGGGLVSPTSLSGPFTGLIDEVEIYDRALSAAEIQAIFNAGSAGKCKEPELSIAKVTGGGQITPNGGGRASFGFTAQREEDGSVSGHLNYLDRDADLHINGPVDEVTASAPTGPVTFSGTACDGTCTFTVTVEDHGEPGKTDTFEITVAGSVTYSASPPTISRGNIQRHF